MHFHLPKPLHGWREFAGEVGIIVVGVLIALGAEQGVQTYHWGNQVDDFQKAVTVEIGLNLGSYQYRIKQNSCTDRRIADLETWWRSWNDGRPLQLTEPVGLPTSLALRTSVWTSRTPDLSGHLPPAVRLNYAQLYDALQNNEIHRLAEREAWIALGAYDGARTLDHQDLIRIRGLINQVKLRQARFTLNIPQVLSYTHALGISARWDPLWPKLPTDLCTSILPQNVSTSRPGGTAK